MIDREKLAKVRQGLKCCVECSKYYCGETCPYGQVDFCKDKMMNDAREILRSMEPRVMTLEEVKALPDESDVWLEEFCCIVVAATVSHQRDIYKVLKRYNQNATYFYGIEHADYNSGEYMDADYGTEWRCWTSRPTEEQREAVKWE